MVPEIKKEVTLLNKAIGICLGEKSFLVYSNGDKIQFPQSVMDQGDLVDKARNTASKKSKGSRNADAAFRDLEMNQAELLRQFDEFVSEEVERLEGEYDLICIERPAENKVSGYAQNRKRIWEKKYLPRFWDSFVSTAKEKAKDSVEVQTEFPGIFVCSSCNSVPRHPIVSKKRITCPICGESFDPEVNLARNIESEGCDRKNFFAKNLTS